MLFNGFKPLFQALSPADVNQLSYEIIQVFQGEGGTLEGLLSHTASVTSTLADRDQVIGSLIDNLNEVLDHIGDRDQQLSRPDHDVPHVRRRPQGRPPGDPRLARPDLRALGADRRPRLGHPRSRSSTTSSSCARSPANLDRNKSELDRALQVLPIKLEKIGRTASYGSWFNFYLCQFQGRVQLPGGVSPCRLKTYMRPGPRDRCDLGGSN